MGAGMASGGSVAGDLAGKLAGQFGPAPRRVNREHGATVPKEYAQLTPTIDFRFRGAKRLTRREVEQDLYELEWHLYNRYT